MYLEDLSQAECDDPNCTHEHDDKLFIHSKCHPDENVMVLYHKGSLDIFCGTCSEFVCSIAVAAQPLKYKCYFCKQLVDGSDFCYGCQEHVCIMCHISEPPQGNHTVEDHQLEKV